MTDAEVETVLLGLLHLADTQGGLLGDIADVCKLLRRRVDALEESYGDVLLELAELRRSTAFLTNMKAATLTMSCLKCGAVYAKEPGAELCGPCWVAAGRPGTTSLYIVRTSATDKETHGDQPA